MPKLRMRQAVRQALADEMQHDPSVILLGEDIAAAGGAFKATEGLLDQFGALRVRDTPISEMGFLGAAVGAAATGLRPVVEMMFIEFMGVALDQLVTEAATLRYLSRGAVSCPMVVRASAGAGLGFGCQHSQMLDHWFRATPGLKVVIPSGSRTAYGLLRAAIRDNDPVVFLEHRALYPEREEVDFGEQAIIPLGTAELVSSGDDVTIVTAGRMLRVAQNAQTGTQEGWTADVIDLRTLQPWDRETVLTSVARTRRLVIIEEASYSGGWGSEIADYVAGELFGEMLAPALRISLPDAPVPFSGNLEERYLPSPAYVDEQITSLLTTGRLPAPWWTKETSA